MAETQIHIIDAFTNVPFKGNPAAVCLLDEPRDASWMQRLAAEINLSETSFLIREAGNVFRLRWFTPIAEVDLCGHATLAAAHFLWETGDLARHEAAIFLTRSGELTAVFDGEWIEMDFPAEPAEASSADADLLERALGVKPLYIGRNRMDILAEIGSEAELLALKPDFGLLQQLPARGVIATAGQSAEGFDFISRCFYPAVGVPEDPVTGSAHCCLAPYWGSKRNQTAFRAFQASSRGGELRLRLNGDRILMAGQAVTVMTSQLRV